MKQIASQEEQIEKHQAESLALPDTDELGNAKHSTPKSSDTKELDNRKIPISSDVNELDNDENLDDTTKFTNIPDDTTSPLEPTSIINKIAATHAESALKIQVAKRCHVGAIRERNEDSCLIFMTETGGHFPLMPFGLYIVADGMGGHQNGHLASKTASRMVARTIVNKIYMPLLQEDGNAIQAPIQEVMTDAVQAAHHAIYSPDPEEDGGTTLTSALILGRRLYIAHVGDTRIYLKTDDKFETLTTDHSLVQRLQDVGQLTAEEASFYQYRHILLRALGQGEEEDIEVDTYMRLLPKAGILLLCTDGLSGLVTDNSMNEILSQDVSLDKMADDLFEAAMAAGGYDNITAILVQFPYIMLFQYTLISRQPVANT